MMLRRFYAGTQSHSRNRISGNPASQHVYHEPIQTFSESHNERAYRSYVAMCTRLGISPVLTFASWSRIVDRQESATITRTHYTRFHAHMGDIVRPELSDHLTGRARGVPVNAVYDARLGHTRSDAHQMTNMGGRG